MAARRHVPGPGRVVLIACVDIPAFPLQLLAAREPTWREFPMAVVDHDKPQGVILWVNERARAMQILPGLRYAAGLSLSRDLRAAVIDENDVREHIDDLSRRLRFYTPEVEASTCEPGVFWLNASGLSLLYPELEKWAGLIHDEIDDAGFISSTTVGHSRFGVYAAAKGMGGVRGRGARARTRVFTDADDERDWVRRVPIARLAFDPALRDALEKLGISTLGGFIDLPEAGVHRRFGATVAELHRYARNETWTPLDAAPPDEPIQRSLELDYAEKSHDRLLGPIDALLREVLVHLRGRGEALNALTLTLTFEGGAERGGEQVERLRPGAPTLDAKRLLSLIRLRLESTFRGNELTDGIIGLSLVVEGMPVKAGQLEMFRHLSRDTEAARDAFAQLRALFGEAAVVRAREREAHLPEARFTWEPIADVPKPKPRPVHMGPLVRRLFPKPIRLTAQQRHEPEGWLIAGIEDGPVDELVGPHVVSGGWWRREVHREYHYVRTRTGRWLWTYRDRQRRAWFLQGEVE